MPVVIDVGIGQRGIWPSTAAMFVHDDPELSVRRVTTDCVSNQATLSSVPRRTDGQPVRCTVKMQVVKNQGLNSRVIVMPSDRLADCFQLRFMENLITFEIERPVSGTGVLRDHFLLRVDKSLSGHPLIPDGFDDANFWVIDGLNARQSIVVTLSNGDDKFINQWQQGVNRGFKGKA